MHERDLLDAPSKAPRTRRAKPRTPPTTLGECQPGDVVAVHICITSHLNHAPFGRVVSGGHESALVDLPADGQIVAVIRQVP